MILPAEGYSGGNRQVQQGPRSTRLPLPQYSVKNTPEALRADIQRSGFQEGQGPIGMMVEGERVGWRNNGGRYER